MAQNRFWIVDLDSKLTLLGPAGLSSVCRLLLLPLFQSVVMQKRRTHLHLHQLIPEKSTVHNTAVTHNPFYWIFFNFQKFSKQTPHRQISIRFTRQLLYILLY